MIPWNHHQQLPTPNLFKLLSRSCVTPPQTVKTTQPFKNRKIDLALLQETDSTKITETQWQKEWTGLCFWNSSPTHQSAGAAILFNENFDDKIQNIANGNTGRLIRISFTLNKLFK